MSRDTVRRPTFDVRCYDLAFYFLEGEYLTDANHVRLAIVIQQAIEDELADIESERLAAS